MANYPLGPGTHGQHGKALGPSSSTCRCRLHNTDLGGVLLSGLGVIVEGTADAQRGGVAVEGITVAARCDRVQAHSVGDLLALAVDLGALEDMESTQHQAYPVYGLSGDVKLEADSPGG